MTPYYADSAGTGKAYPEYVVSNPITLSKRYAGIIPPNNLQAMRDKVRDFYNEGSYENEIEAPSEMTYLHTLAVLTSLPKDLLTYSICDVELNSHGTISLTFSYQDRWGEIEIGKSSESYVVFKAASCLRKGDSWKSIDARQFTDSVLAHGVE